MKTITIPTRSLWSILIALAILGFAYIQAIGYIIPGFQTILELKAEFTTINHIGLIWVPLISYLIIGSFICMVARIFKELKLYKEKGLIWGLFRGLFVSLIWGITMGLIAGLICGLISSFIDDLISGLIWGLIGGLIWGLTIILIIGLIWGLIWGLILEFLE